MKSLSKVLAVGTVGALVLLALPRSWAVRLFIVAAVFVAWRLSDA